MGFGSSSFGLIGNAATAATGLTLVSSETVSGGAVAYVDFSGLDLDTDGFYIVLARIINATANSGNIELAFNSDTVGANYYCQRMLANNAALSGARYNDAIIGSVVASKDTTIMFIISRGGSGKPTAQSLANSDEGATLKLDNWCLNWETANNVTAMRILLTSSATMDNGSEIRIYKTG